MTVDKFFNIMEPHLLSNEQINAVCGLSSNDNEKNNTISNKTDNNNQANENVNYITVEKDKYHNALVIIFASLFGVSLLLNALAIYAIYSLMKKNNSEQIQK